MAQRLRDRILASPAGAERALRPDEMLALARSVDLEQLDLEGHRCFDPVQYARNTVYRNDHFELVVICWMSQQASSIHDHGRSNCLYLVVEGEMQEERFELNDQGRPRRSLMRTFDRGAITLASPEVVHRIVNPGAGELVTLHIYSPPLDDAVTHFTPIPRREPRETM